MGAAPGVQQGSGGHLDFLGIYETGVAYTVHVREKEEEEDRAPRPPMGKFVCSTGDGQIYLLRARGLVVERKTSLGGAVHAARSITYSHCGKQILAGCSNGRVRTLDVATGKFTHDATRYDDPVLSVACAPSCERVASGSANGKLRFTRTGPNSSKDIPIAEIIHNQYTNRPTFDREVLRRKGPTSNHVPATELLNGQLTNRTFWDWEIDRRGGPSVNALAWAPRGARLASGFGNGKVQIIGATVDCEVTLGASVLCIAWRPPRGEMLAVGLANGALHVLHVATGSSDYKTVLVQHGRSELFFCRASPVYCLAWDVCGTWLAAGCKDGTLRCLGVEEANQSSLNELTLKLQYEVSPAGRCSGVNGVAWCPSGAWIVVACEDGHVRLLESGEGNVKQSLHLGGRVISLAWAPPPKIVSRFGERQDLKSMRRPGDVRDALE